MTQWTPGRRELVSGGAAGLALGALGLGAAPARAAGIDTRTGPRGPSVISGMLTSEANSEGWSSRRLIRPLMATIWSRTILSDTCAQVFGKNSTSMPDSRSSSVAIAHGAPCLLVRGPTAVRMPAMSSTVPAAVKTLRLKVAAAGVLPAALRISRPGHWNFQPECVSR